MSCLPYLPKTDAYINQTFNTAGDQRGGHHNYVAEREIGNLSTSFDNQSKEQQAITDDAILKHLMSLDEMYEMEWHLMSLDEMQ